MFAPLGAVAHGPIYLPRKWAPKQYTQASGSIFVFNK
jgi:hypothetical protein